MDCLVNEETNENKINLFRKMDEKNYFRKIGCLNGIFFFFYQFYCHFVYSYREKFISENLKKEYLIIYLNNENLDL